MWYLFSYFCEKHFAFFNQSFKIFLSLTACVYYIVHVSIHFCDKTVNLPRFVESIRSRLTFVKEHLKIFEQRIMY